MNTDGSVRALERSGSRFLVVQILIAYTFVSQVSLDIARSPWIWRSLAGALSLTILLWVFPSGLFVDTQNRRLELKLGPFKKWTLSMAEVSAVRLVEPDPSKKSRFMRVKVPQVVVDSGRVSRRVPVDMMTSLFSLDADKRARELAERILSAIAESR